MTREIRLGICYVAAFASILAGQVAGKKPVASLRLEAEIQSGYVWTNFPRWGGGRLVCHENNDSGGPLLYTVERDGRHNQTQFAIEGVASITIHYVASSQAGEIAVVGSARTADRAGSTFVARVSPLEGRQLVTRTWPYVPFVVAYVPDGTLWTIGILKNEDNTRDMAYHVLRRFDQNGKMLSSISLKVRGERSGENVTYLQSSRDRVGWYTRAGEYIEFSLDGTEIGRYEGPAGVEEPYSRNWSSASMALSEDGQVIVAISDDRSTKLHALNRATRSWTPITVPEGDLPKWTRLFGFDGTNLVTNAKVTGKFRQLRTQ